MRRGRGRGQRGRGKRREKGRRKGPDRIKANQTGSGM
jgi:hypothetical protein